MRRFAGEKMEKRAGKGRRTQRSEAREPLDTGHWTRAKLTMIAILSFLSFFSWFLFLISTFCSVVLDF